MNKTEWKYILRFLKDFAERNLQMMVQSISLAVLGAVRPYINIVLMGFLLDSVHSGESAETLLRYAFLALGSNVLLRIVEGRIREWYNQRNEYIREIEGRALNRKSLTIDYEYLEDSHVQELRYRSQAEGNYIGLVGWLVYRIEQLTTYTLSMVLALFILVPLFVTSKQGEGFLCSWQCSLLLFLAVGAFVWFNYRYNSSCSGDIKAKNDESTREYNRVNFYLNKLAGVESQKDLRIYAQQDLIGKDVERAHGAMVKALKEITGIYIRRSCVGRALSDLSGLLIYLFTGLRAYAGMISIGGVVTYAASIIRFSQAVGQFAVTLADIRQLSMYCRDYAEYMDLSKRKYDGTIPMEKRRDNKFSVEFEHVSFRYPGTDRDVIHDLNLKFTIGEKMAIVGRNGSGKTTFIKLLCRLYDVTEGCIKVNGIDIRKYNYQEYCDLFAVVFQDFSVFAFPLGENVASGGQVEEERALEALYKAGLGERFENLPEGLGTYVGKDFAEDGISFSGGEKQKMAIARAIYKNAPFVIMDEPTAALDPVSECEVFAGFDEMVGNKTAIYISHRLASCRFCEDILVFDRGQVVQRGSHSELEGQDGLYRELWNAQAQYYGG